MILLNTGFTKHRDVLVAEQTLDHRYIKMRHLNSIIYYLAKIRSTDISTCQSQLYLVYALTVARQVVSKVSEDVQYVTVNVRSGHISFQSSSCFLTENGSFNILQDSQLLTFYFWELLTQNSSKAREHHTLPYFNQLRRSPWGCPVPLPQCG